MSSVEKLTQQDPRNQIRIFFSLFRWGKAKREDFRKKASSADDLEGRQGKTETTDTEPGLMKDHRIDTLWFGWSLCLLHFVALRGTVQ
ncbi:hypothetical protein VNO77_50428 [Canavalia gladiata]|uniref:Uncharacterized protein n=1 Tax=Canavalia gladiata TaxID=3824 RepID=A0AAN9JEN9_CANGL